MRSSLRVAALRVVALVAGASSFLLACSPPPPTTLNPQEVANAGLALDATYPQDIDLFSSTFPNATGIYPSGSAMTISSGPPLTEQQALDQLALHLGNQLGDDVAKKNAGLALFADPALSTQIPNPVLRAALVGTMGTIYEPAIDAFLDEHSFVQVRFGGLPNSSIVASVTGGGGSQILTVNTIYSGVQDFRVLVPTMGHEIAIHGGDSLNSNAEEAIAHGMTGMAWAQMIEADPQLAHLSTQLSRINNTDCMLFLNSTEAGSPDSELYAPTGRGVAPGSPFDANDLWTLRDGSGSSPASAVFGEILNDLGLPTASSYDQMTAESFADLNDTWLSDVGRARVSVALGLLSPEEISTVVGTSTEQVIELLGLAPYLPSSP